MRKGSEMKNNAVGMNHFIRVKEYKIIAKLNNFGDLLEKQMTIEI